MLAVALLLSACASAPQGERAASALAPAWTLRGARLEASGPYTPFVNPVAVAGAGSGQEIYVADAGLAMLARVDAVTGVMKPVVRRAFVAGTRLAADADGTLYLLEPAARRVRRFARDGRELADFIADATVGSFSDLVLDPSRGRVLVADSLNRQIVAFHPLGRAFEVLPLRASERDTLFALGALASGRDALYASDPRCACIVRIGRDGRVLGSFGHGELQRPGRLAVDRYERVIVADAAVKVFAAGRRVETVPANAGDLALADDWLYVTEGAAVRAFRIFPP